MPPPMSGNGADTARPPVKLEVISAASFAGQPIPRQRWLVPDLIPAGNVTILSGDGATGKSLLGLQLAVAVATGGEWIGTAPEPGKALFVSAEDEIEEIHRRLARIEPDLSTLEDLSIIPMAGKDAVLAAPEGRDGSCTQRRYPPPCAHLSRRTGHPCLFQTRSPTCSAATKSKRFMLANSSGSCAECASNSKPPSFCSRIPRNRACSRARAFRQHCQDNSVRSRLYLERRKTKDGAEDDSDIRTLTTKKANRVAVGSQIVVRYCDGKFVRENDAARVDEREREAERVFIDLLRQFEIEGRTASHHPCPTYAPRQFAKHPSANKISTATFERAMSRLLERGKIKIDAFGPPSKPRSKIVLVRSRHDNRHPRPLRPPRLL